MQVFPCVLRKQLSALFFECSWHCVGLLLILYLSLYEWLSTLVRDGTALLLLMLFLQVRVWHTPLGTAGKNVITYQRSLHVMPRRCVNSNGVPALLHPELGLKHSAIFLNWLKVQTFAECQSVSID